MKIFAMTTDLMFGSQMSAAAAQSGSELQTFANVEMLLQSLRSETTTSWVVLDLTCPSAQKEMAELVQQIRAASASTRVLAFGPHVHESALQAAQSAGCDLVLSRGQFHRQMDEIFRGTA